MSKPTKKTGKIAARQKQKRNENLLTWGGIGLVLVAVLVALLMVANPPSTPLSIMGTEVPITSARHIPESQVPGPYTTNPPTGGPHYERTFDAGFYQESDLEALGPNPEGHLVHNLEHGYIIFWYNCEPLNEQACTDMKNNIQTVIDEFNGLKVTAFPWNQEEPLVMTSWGRFLSVDPADVETMRSFVKSNRFKAPEPNAP